MTKTALIEHGEHLVHATDEHWVKYVVPTLVAFLLFGISFLLFLLAGFSAHHEQWLANTSFVIALTLFFFSFHWYFLVLLSESLDRIVITNRRLIRVRYRLLFDEDILEVSFDKMKTVDAVKRGIIQNILHYGTILFETKLASITLVPHPNRVARIIQDAMRAK